MMVTDSGETLNSDPVMNVFRTFSQLGRQPIQTRLEISDHSQFATNICQASTDFRVNFVVFPVEIGAQTYPVGWAGTVASMLYARSKCTVGIFGDRGFGVSSSVSITSLMEPIPGNNQKVAVLYAGDNDDDLEVLSVLKSMVEKDGLLFEILYFERSNSNCNELKKFWVACKSRGLNNIKLTSYSSNEQSENLHEENLTPLDGRSPGHSYVKLSESEEEYMFMIKLLKDKYGPKDLIIMGHSTYTTFDSSIKNQNQDSDRLCDFIDGECKSSFLVVKKGVIGANNSNSAGYPSTPLKIISI